MKNILSEIVETKKVEVAERKKLRSIEDLNRSPLYRCNPFSLREFLRMPDRTGIIAEFKRKSPSKGIINDRYSVKDITCAYSRYGASGLSVLTDGPYFGGSVEDLKEARAINRIPILRKDFVIDEYQIAEAKAIGADVILLIAECLTKDEVAHLSKYAEDLGLEVLLEVNSLPQLEKVAPSVHLVGVNNRDLTTFTVDINRSFELAEQIPSDKYKVAESGINDVASIVSLKKAGFDGFLIGEHFMKQENPPASFETFANYLKEQLKSI
ncbi:indole-3-glycerol phosphate synthase TrpC [Chitinophaga horti]|uniref:Indole-3-glycerol phosphate synthase n=1 Tax=Chitinophaga horti TaxID=2920382 RepID=A0ABY6J6D0_9BACT|nr:indole-3-glycerol phosphate synthase TrpC [Chitinophaga horti]UYQ93839.1 indole-3-glycerol phosphate synthase TrpC [Chitinophaga horti]